MVIYSSITFLCFIQYVLIRGRGLTTLEYKLTGLILIGFFAAFAGLRGMVGTDTWMYTHVVAAIGNGKQVSLEPGFIYLAKLFTSLTNDATLAVNSFSLLFFAFAAIYLIRATRTEAIYLFAFFAPQYFIPYSFNGLRIGLASILFILALQFWRREKRIVFLALLALALSLQHTIILAVGIFFLFIKPILRRKAIAIRLLFMCFLVGIVIALNEYISDRIETYLFVQRFDVFAGLSYLILVPLLMVFIWQLPIPKREIREKFFLSMGMLALGLVIIAKSYAGLRIMNIVMWLIPLLFIYSLERDKTAGRQFHTGLAVVGFVGALGVLRNIAGSHADFTSGNSPYLPYHFMREIGF